MEVSRVGAEAGECGRRYLIDSRLDGRDAILLERVSEEPRFDSSGSRLPLLQQLLEHCPHAFRADAGANDIVEPFLIRFGLVCPTEARKQSSTGDVDRGVRHSAIADA